MATEISVVVPVYNEELLIKSFLTELDQACRETGSSYEIITVENGSTDKTREIIAGLRRNLSKVKLYSLPVPGYGEALLYGFRKARGRFVVFFNADFWDKKFLSIIKKDIQKQDMVIGSKMLPESEDRRPLVRRIYSGLFSRFLKIAFGYPGTDTHGIKVLRRKTVKPVFESCTTRSGIIDTELMIKAYRNKLRILEIPVKVAEVRPARFGYKRFFQTPRDIWDLIKAVA